MGSDIQWACRCGDVALRFPAEKALGVACYCNFCRHFFTEMGAGNALDASGGVKFFHIVLNQITIEKGFENLAAVHYTTNGPRRWYATCCNTPFANMPKSPNLPYATVTSHWAAPPDAFSQPGIVGFRKSATGPPLMTHHSPISTSFTLALRTLLARIGGGHKNTPFFDQEGNLTVPLERRPRP